MAVVLGVRSPDKSNRVLSAAFLPYGSFHIYLWVRDVPPLPLNIKIIETPHATAGPAGSPIGGGPILILDKPTMIKDPGVPLRSYKVTNLRSFELHSSYVKFQLHVNRDTAALNAFRGSVMQVTVTDNSAFSESAQISVLTAVPNNHFHWRREPQFVDGAYFKCVHIDEQKKTATPFFFLYGVNNPGGGDGSESFVMFGKSGSIALNASLRPDAGAVPEKPEPQHGKPRPSGSEYIGEELYGLDAKISTDFSATDTRLAGKNTLNSGSEASWDLRLTKLHTSYETDWNPFAVFKRIPGFGDEELPGSPLMKYKNAYPLMTAFYMSHNMNGFISGTIKWGNVTYNFENHKGYQDSNWGSGGFPHPYVWMQANNFVSDSGQPLHNTSLVALFTPAMPVIGLPSQLVAGICLRHNNNTYQILGVDPKLLFAGAIVAPTTEMIFLKMFRELGLIQCSVGFNHDGSVKTVDMSNIGDIDAKIGKFPRTSEALPIKWEIHGKNSQDDEVSIVAECQASTVMSLSAPKDGRMTDGVTKETLLARFTVKLKPKGGTEISLISDFGTAEYGD